MDETPDELFRANALVRELAAWRPLGDGQDSLRLDYLEFLKRRGASSFDRGSGPAHLSASSFVLTPDLARVLLCFHKKGQFWVQLGGHIEPGDRSVAAAAFREALEEGGIHDLDPISIFPLDVDRHDLGAGFTKCDVHWDAGFGAIAAQDAVPVTSCESDDVRWWPVTSLPPQVPEGLNVRLQRILTAARISR